MRCLTWSLALILTAGLGAATPAEEEVLATMEAWRQATQNKDVEALGKLLHPDLTYSHSDGKNETRADVLSGLTTSGKREIVVKNPKVRVYGNTALVKADVDFINVEVNPRSAAHLNALHVLLKGPAGWQLVARQSTRLNR